MQIFLKKSFKKVHFANSTLQNEDFLHFFSFLFAYSNKFAILQFVRVYAFLCAAHYGEYIVNKRSLSTIFIFTIMFER